MYSGAPENSRSSSSAAAAAAATRFTHVDNFKACEAKFRRVMSNKYGLVFDAPQDTADLRQMLFSEMQLVAASAKQNDTVQGLNTIVLNATRDRVLNSHKQQQQQQQQQQRMETARQAPMAPMAPMAPNAPMAMARDRDVYGPREVSLMNPSLMPVASNPPGANEDVGHSFEAANQRYAAPPSMENHSSDVARMTQVVPPMNTGEFENRLAERLAEMQQVMQQEQLHQQQGNREIPPSLPMGPFVVQPPPDALVVIRKAQEDADEFRRMAAMQPLAPVPPMPLSAASGESGGGGGPFGYAPMIPHPSAAKLIPGGPLMSTRAESLIASPRITQVVPRYILVNGADRNVIAEPYRYQFTVRTGGAQSIATLQSSYTNIAWLEVTRVIVPQEITSAIGTVATISGNYNTEYSFAYPYLLLNIDGISDTCDGTNDAMRRAFSSLIYNTEYKAPNGRGYVSLMPGQMERKTYMSPMSSLPDLKISLLKPNGTLFNNSQDAYTVLGTLPKVSSANANYMVITTDQYFDRNELWVGDNVTITGLVLQATSSSNTPFVNALQTYLTQTSGLEIVDLPPSTTNYYNGICVKIPGMFNQATGAVVPDSNISSILNNGSFKVASKGVIMNTSLQAVVMMTAGVVMGAGLPPVPL